MLTKEFLSYAEIDIFMTNLSINWEVIGCQQNGQPKARVRYEVVKVGLVTIWIDEWQTTEREAHKAHGNNEKWLSKPDLENILRNKCWTTV